MLAHASFSATANSSGKVSYIKLFRKDETCALRQEACLGLAARKAVRERP